MIAFIAVVAALVAEALAVYTASEWIAAGYADGRHSVSAFTLVAVALIAYRWPRFSANLELPAFAVRALTGVLTFTVLYGALRIEFAGDLALWDFGWMGHFLSDSSGTVAAGSAAMVGALLLVGMWVRASLRAADGVALDTLTGAIGVAFAAVTVMMVFGAMGGHAAEVGRGGAAFYGAAVLALACAQLSQSGATFGDLRAGGVTAGLLAGVAGGVVACLALFGLVFGLFGNVLGAVAWFVVRTVLLVVLVPMAWLFGLVANALLGDARLQIKPEEIERIGPSTEQKEGGSSLLDTILTFGLRGLALLLAAVVVVAVVALAMSLRRKYRERERREAPAVATVSIEGEGHGWWRRLGRHGEHARHGTARGVFRLYREVLDDAARRGARREPFETPEEFAPTLAATFNAPVTDEITFAFEEARYAGREPGAAALAEMERRWRERR